MVKLFTFAGVNIFVLSVLPESLYLYVHRTSILGHRAPPIGVGNHFYSATKFAVRSLTEGHRQELKELKTNIRVAVRLLAQIPFQKLNCC